MIPPGHSPTPPSTSPRRTCPSRRPHPPQRKALGHSCACCSAGPEATAAPPAQTVTKPGIWDAKPLAAFSGNELVYSATLGDWRTHNGADYAAPAGEVTAGQGGQGRSR